MSVMSVLLRKPDHSAAPDYLTSAAANRLPPTSCRALRRDLQHRLHVGMEAAVVFDDAGLVEHRRDCLLRWQVDVEITVARGRGVGEHVLVHPFDGVADLGRNF